MITRIALACLLVIAPAAALAVADGPDHFTTRNLAKGQSLTLHVGPSTSAVSAGKIAAGTSCIRNLGCRVTTDAPPPGKTPPETWCEVQSGNVKGYAQAKYLAEGSCDSKDAPASAAVAFVPLVNGKGTVKGEIHGDKDARFRIPAAAGQKLTVAMQSSNASAYFNISAPGQAPEGMFNGSMGGKFEQVMLPDDGEYLVTVYFMRSAARRGASAKFTLSIELEGKALMPVPAAQDALVRGTRFHATAPIPCTPPFGLKLPCEAGAVRRANGAATVDIRMGPELRRRILFAGGKPVASDATGEMVAVRKGDVTVVTMDDESYSIPDALISGG